MRARGAARALVGHAADGAQVFSQERVRGLLDPAGDVGVGRAARGRIVFEAAVFGRVVRGRDDDPVSQPGCAAAVIAKDGVRDDRRRRVAAIPVDHHLDAVGGQHLEGAHKGRLGQRVGVHPHEERTVDPVRLAIRANGLRDGQNVRFVEGALERRAAVPGRPERDALRRDGGIGMLRVVRRHQSRDVDQHRGWRRLAGKRTDLRHPSTTSTLMGRPRHPTSRIGALLSATFPSSTMRDTPWLTPCGFVTAIL